jgi:hypothetical protein
VTAWRSGDVRRLGARGRFWAKVTLRGTSGGRAATTTSLPATTTTTTLTDPRWPRTTLIISTARLFQRRADERRSFRPSQTPRPPQAKRNLPLTVQPPPSTRAVRTLTPAGPPSNATWDAVSYPYEPVGLAFGAARVQTRAAHKTRSRTLISSFPDRGQLAYPPRPPRPRTSSKITKPGRTFLSPTV